MLKTITSLSHRYGGNPDFVLAGGGNTSCKDDTYLYVKPSGVRLADIKESDFVKMNRSAIRKCFELKDFKDVNEREEKVKNMMAAAVCEGSSGRPSVEAPLHELLTYRYIVHVHPAKVNGMTCGKNGKAEAAVLFPLALWVDYTDPGFTLAKKVYDDIEAYKKCHDNAVPKIIFLQNHGVFVAADSAEEINELYQMIMSALDSFYVKKQCSTALSCGELDSSVQLDGYTASAPFKTACGPLTPDHIVYAKSFSLVSDAPDAGAAGAFEAEHGYAPYVIEVPGRAVLTISGNDNVLPLAQDASLVQQLAGAFGGVNYLSDAHRSFIENWEVESYRRKVAAQNRK